MDTISLWKATQTDKPCYEKLDKSIHVDVAIVGGGITGLTAALYLVEAGKKVAILEANKIGEGTTGFSTGNLYVATQPYYYNIIAKFGEEAAKIIAKSRLAAINQIENIVSEKDISCKFARRPWYLHTGNETKIAEIEKEIDALQKLGMEIEPTSHVPLPMSIKKAAMMPHQARFNPLAYCVGLAKYLASKGCLIFEDSQVVSYTEKEACELKTVSGTVKAGKMVLATHTPIGINLTQLFTAPYRSYVVSVHLNNNEYPDGNFWDIDNPHHAISTHPADSDKLELLMIAGNHHKTGQGKDMVENYFKHEEYLNKYFDVNKVAYRWSAQHYHAADDVPYIGLASRGAKHTYIATGYFADGLVYGTIAGTIISNLILQNVDDLAAVYNSNRIKPFASMPSLIKENMNVFTQFIKDFSAPGAQDINKIKSGEGRVVKLNGEKCAVSRDQNNQLHVVSAICPHMKCTVHWNNAEMTWDCPCHGSRFTCDGKYIEGPAESGLEVREIKNA